MSMQDISDKELDQFFKKSTEDPNIPFEENAWAKMEQSLKKHDQQQRKRRYRHTALVVLAVYFLSAVSVRTLERSSSPHTSSYLSSSEKANTTHIIEKEKEKEKKQYIPVHANKETGSHAELIEKEKEEKKYTPAKANKELGVHTELIEKQIEEQIDSKEQPKANKTHTRKYHSEASLATLTEQEQQSNLLTADSIDRTAKEITDTGHTPILSNPIVFSTIEVPKTSVTSEEIKNLENTKSKQDADQNIPIALAADSTEKLIPLDSLLPLAAQTTKDSVQKKDNTPIKRRFSFGILASPDFSFTSSTQFVTPGLSAGIFAEYHINHRWAIFVGVMRSSKIYSSSAADYNSTNTYWAYKGYATRVDGSCAVLDVPLNVKYHYYNRNKNLLFASAGISSYFMLHEKYSFVYSNGDERSWTYTNKENYFFSLLNVSLGYERYIGKSFSVQVEPFVKIPLHTIGEGQVKLLTTGMFFCLKYSIH
ncbi:MAG: hypothetical protein JWM14_2123 [Chitinophagaceae bacterium]|nr:hypothetical protein [Chitinophagaceae bacterium]